MPRVQSALHIATGNDRDCCTATVLLVRVFGHIIISIYWLQLAVTIVARGSAAGSRYAQNVSSSVVAKDGGEESEL